jgi:signal transduction histidine kinase
MTPYSLRLRLLAGAAVAVFAALAIAWVAMTLLFQRHLELRVEQELRRDALQLVAGLTVDPAGTITVQQEPTDPRFGRPAGGLYWQIGTGEQSQRSRSLWDEALAPSPAADTMEWRTRRVDGPFGQRLFLLERLIQPAGSMESVLVQLALDENELRVARDDFSLTLALFLLLLWVVLSGAAWIQVQLGLRPLKRLRHELSSLRHNASERLSAGYPLEVEPLTKAINDLANAREADVKRARQRAADLAHGMKTPLAALAAQSRLIREGRGDPHVSADGLDRAISAAGAAVEAELARARAAASRHARQEAQAAPLSVAQRLILVLERTEKGMRLDYVLEVPEDLRLAVAAEDLSEILGPLLENAVRFARRQVRVSGAVKDGSAVLSVEDDGPGLSTAEAAEAVVRGVRLDQTGGGHGLGLAIARELAEATGGTIELGTSSLGGLRIELRWKNADRLPGSAEDGSGAWTLQGVKNRLATALSRKVSVKT